MNKVRLYLKKTTYLTVVFLILMASIPSFAISKSESKVENKKPQKTETYKDIIEKAQLLSLQKDRQQAILILEMALKKEGSRGIAAIEIKKQINDLNRVFISDKTQNLYELGMSFLPKDSTQATQKINEALRLEPDNLQLLLSQMRLNLSKKDCSGAAAIFKKQNLKKFTLLDAELNLMQAQISFCQKSYSDLQLFFSTDNKKNPYLKYWYNLEVQRCIEDRNFARAKDLIHEIIKIDPNYAEASYLDWKLNVQAEGKNLASGQKYLFACKSIAQQEFQRNFVDPNYCSNTVEVEKAGTN